MALRYGFVSAHAKHHDRHRYGWRVLIWVDVDVAAMPWELHERSGQDFDVFVFNVQHGAATQAVKKFLRSHGMWPTDAVATGLHRDVIHLDAA